MVIAIKMILKAYGVAIGFSMVVGAFAFGKTQTKQRVNNMIKWKINSGFTEMCRVPCARKAIRVGLPLAMANLLFIKMVPMSTAQSADVPITRSTTVDMARLGQEAEKFRGERQLLTKDVVIKQLERTSCRIDNLTVNQSKELLDGSAIWKKARASFVRVGWYYLCPNCDVWHVNLGGGCYLTEDGVAATAFHVIAVQSGMREGFLVAATEEGLVMPVTEVLAASEVADTAIIRVKVPGKVCPLSLNPATRPGEQVWCYSNPLEHTSYFSSGVINRFIDFRTDDKAPQMNRMDVSCDWAPGSSGSAVLDRFGNAIGLVSALEILKSPGEFKEPLLIFHRAALAQGVLNLTEKREAADGK